MDGDQRAVVDARVQIDAMLAGQEHKEAVADSTSATNVERPGSLTASLQALTGRIDAVTAALSEPASRPQHSTTAVPAWLNVPPGALQPLLYGGVGLACLAALIAAAAAVLAGRRVSSGHEAAHAAMLAAGKLFEAAARRFTRAQDEASNAAELAAGAAGQAGKAASRLAGASQEAESRLRACIDDAEARLHGAGTLARQFDHAAAGLPALLADAVAKIGARVVPIIEDASASLREGADGVRAQLAAEARALPALLADAILGAAAIGMPAMDAAIEKLTARAEAVALAGELLPAATQSVQQAVTALNLANACQSAGLLKVEGLAALLPEVSASFRGTEAQMRALVEQGATLLHGGRDELARATVQITQATAAGHDTAVQIAAFAAALPAAADSLTDTAACLRQEALELADGARIRDANQDQFAGWVVKCMADLPDTALALGTQADRMNVALQNAADLREAVVAASAWPVAASAIAESAHLLRAEAAAAHMRGDAAREALAGTGQAMAWLPGAAENLAAAGLRIETVLEQNAAALEANEAARATEAAETALMLDALSARADAACGALPVEAAALAAVARDIAAGAVRLVDEAHAQGTMAQDARAVLAQIPRALVGAEAVCSRLSAAGEELTGAGIALRLESVVLRDEAVCGQAGLLAAGAAVTRLAQDAAEVMRAGDTRATALDSAVVLVEAAAARVAHCSSVQESAALRVAEAVREVSACLAIPQPASAAPPMVNLARLNGLAAEATTLHAQADRLAAAALRGNAEDVPVSLVQEAPSLLAAIETSIQRLRGTATALALASDAARRAA
jgi:hypothetical protein